MSANVITPQTVTLIVPCLNEEPNVSRLVSRLEAMQIAGRGWEVIIVDDGSTDATRSLTEQLAQSRPWLRLVRHPRNLGLGAAVRTGLSEARGSIICTMDADCTMAPEYLPEMIAAIRNGADMVTASPWHPKSNQGSVHPVRKVLSRGCSLLYQLVLRSDLYCYTALLRAHRRPVMEAIQVNSNGFVAVAEMMVNAIRSGYRVVELPVTLDRRQHGDSKISVTASIKSHVRLLTRLGWKSWQPQQAPAYKLAE